MWFCVLEVIETNVNNGITNNYNSIIQISGENYSHDAHLFPKYLLFSFGPNICTFDFFRLEIQRKTSFSLVFPSLIRTFAINLRG